jgi:hypothetical protein
MSIIYPISIIESHESFGESEIFYDWQYQNRWIKIGADGNEVEILPTIYLRLYDYARCPCCTETDTVTRITELEVSSIHSIVHCSA